MTDHKPSGSKKKQKSRVSILAGGIIAVFGGLLIVTSGFRTGSFLLSAANYSEQRFGSDLPGIAQSAMHFAILGLSLVIGFGGLLAVLGGIIIISRHVTVGKILLGLGGGVGFIGIAISMGFSIYESGLSIIVLHVDYWIGVLIASIGRYLA